MKYGDNYPCKLNRIPMYAWPDHLNLFLVFYFYGILNKIFDRPVLLVIL